MAWGQSLGGQDSAPRQLLQGSQKSEKTVLPLILKKVTVFSPSSFNERGRREWAYYCSYDNFLLSCTLHCLGLLRQSVFAHLFFFSGSTNGLCFLNIKEFFFLFPQRKLWKQYILSNWVRIFSSLNSLFLMCQAWVVQRPLVLMALGVCGTAADYIYIYFFLSNLVLIKPPSKLFPKFFPLQFTISYVFPKKCDPHGYIHLCSAHRRITGREIRI